MAEASVTMVGPNANKLSLITADFKNADQRKSARNKETIENNLRPSARKIISDNPREIEISALLQITLCQMFRIR